MFKLGRGAGAGRGNGKRPLPAPPPTTLHRPGAAPGGRLPIGASAAAARSRPGGTSVAPSAPAREETFSLESGGGPPDFAAIIRLTPDLVDEIRRVEAQGGIARIKFDSNFNTSGNVIDVGGKEFSFTWSRELGDLCDIYEEHRSGEGGHGLLVESGSAWRKLTVQRILDESTKNHVKMRSEEAERLSKSRKAIVLDPANPSVKNQAKTFAAAAVEGSMRRMNWKQKKEFFKKRKTDSNQVSHIGPSRPVVKSVTASNNNKGRLSVSPLPSPPEQHVPGTSGSTFGISTSLKGQKQHDDNIPSSNINKEESGNFKEVPSRVSSGVKHDASGHAVQVGDQLHDLRHLLITVLSENPKGMSLKALEKAVGERVPNSVKKIESVIKHITICQAPGRYFLKPGVELESSIARAPESGSSPESSHDHTEAVVADVEKALEEKIEHETNSNLNPEEELDITGNIDTVGSSQDPFSSDMKANNDSQVQACSSSESGSDSESDSESSGSGSDSGSQSRASSSDSESDGSSSSKEGSDVDVDIMTSDNEKEVVVHKAMTTETLLSSSPKAWTIFGDEHVKNDVRMDQEAQVPSPPIDLNDSDKIDQMTEVVEPSKCFPPNGSNEAFENLEANANFLFSEKGASTSPYRGKQLERQQMPSGNYSFNDVNEQVLKSSNNERQTTPKDGSNHEPSDSSKKVTKQKPKRAFTSEYSEGRPEGAKKAKVASSAQFMSSRKSEDATFSGGMPHVSPERPRHDGYKDRTIETQNFLLGGKSTDSDSQECSPAMYGRTLAPGNSSRMPPSPDFASGLDNRNKGSDSMEKPSRYIEKTGKKYAEITRDNLDRDLHLRDNFNLKEKMQKDIRNNNSDVKERYFAKNVGEISGAKFSAFHDSCQTKSSEHFGTSKINGQQTGKEKSDGERSQIVGGKGSMLRRELSDLELGEFRETPKGGEESAVVKIQLDRKGSFKTLENKVPANDGSDFEKSKGRASVNSDLEISKGRTCISASRNLKKQSPTGSRVAGQGNHGLQRRDPAESFSDSAQPAQPQPRTMVCQNEQLPAVDHANSEAACWDKSAETASRNEKRSGQKMGLENHSGAYKKIHANMLQHDNKNSGQTGQNNGELAQKSNASDQSKNNVLMVNDGNDRSRRDSSSDEDNFFYLKYDKDEPELRGPIKDLSEYKQYVQEYREKYEVYCYLNKNLEKIRNVFLQLGDDLEIAKGRDVKEYYNVVEKLREMYHHYQERNRQMKKVFILLHEELKTLKQRIKTFADGCTNE
ncbi:unnamed protein product [Musa acuminata var. zebrina]